MLIEQVPDIFRPFLRGVEWRMDHKERVIYLTFDDGPTTENTLWILDLLDAHNIKATFFCVGANVEKHPDLYQEILKRGHKVGVHGYNHKRGLYKDNEAFMADIATAEKFIDSNLMRPPHGHITRSQIKELGKKYRIILWDVITRDYNRNLSGERVLGIAKRYSRNGSIVVFHDSVKAMDRMRYALPKAIEYWEKQGYKFNSL